MALQLSVLNNSISLTVKLHDVMVGNAADRALLTSSGALYTGCHMTAWNESSVALVLIAEFAHLDLDRWWSCCSLLLLSWFYFLQLWLWNSDVYLTIVATVKRLFILLFVVHQHELSVWSNFVTTLARPELHLLNHAVHFLVRWHSAWELLSILRSFVNYWHILQVVYFWAFNNEDCASNLNDVTDTQGVKWTLLAFSAKSEPRTICGSHICKIKACPLLIRSYWASLWFIADLGMIVTHLRIFLDAERVLLVASDC